MRIVLALAGALVVALTFMDVLQTTIMARASGSFSDRLTSMLWRGLMAGRRGGDHTKLSQAGIVIMMLVIGGWILLVWIGWTLVFWGSEQALLNAQTKAPASFMERGYFIGYTMTTLGLGDYQPNGTLWQMLTVVASLTGLTLVTFAITYVMPVMQAATHRRSLAVHIAGLGLSTEAVVRTAREADGSCEAFEQHLAPLAPEIALVAQRHLAYPVLHYFHGANRREAFTPSVATLDEALLVLDAGFEEACLRRASLRPVRAAIAELLETLDKRAMDPTDEPPDLPSLAAYRADGWPVASDAAFERAAEEHAERRSLLWAMVRSEGWDWDAARTGDGEGAEPARQADVSFHDEERK